nr:MAG TPA: hypothetical protein [Caudoviricetes sp.]
MPYYNQTSLKADTKYKKANIVKVNMSLNRNTDGDILSYIATIDNKQGYLKCLIRADMARRSKEEPGE